MADLLPNVEQARIDARKLRDSALNPEHPSGRYKAEFFRQMGYTAEDWQELERDIREQHLSQVAQPGKSSPHGSKYVITAPLRGPLGSPRQVTTVWLIRHGNDFAELVTKEPASRRKES
jgi:filamentous hemagglutinin